jgi:hypothetical protein
MTACISIRLFLYCFFHLASLVHHNELEQVTAINSINIHLTIFNMSSLELSYPLTSLLLFASIINAQQTTPFTDPLTGINFQRFFGARTQFAFGIALPENPSTDFIGQISAPMPNGAGWAGISLQEDMEGPLLLTAWPNGAEVVHSFRVAGNEDDSPPVATGAFKVLPILTGTVVNAGHMTFTFLCQNCIGNAKTGFTASDTAGDFQMGWALASRAVSDAADPATVLPFHDSGMYLDVLL